MLSLKISPLRPVIIALLAVVAAEALSEEAVQQEYSPKDLNTLREFPSIGSRKEWQIRAREIREQVLVSCGLWPLPEKNPLNAQVFGKLEREGYSIEKVYLETYPGFYLAGNLYRPLGRGKGPFPAILNPHGHWANGRMADQKDGSIAARCISFARQGMIAFSYDMVGYNDTHFSDTPTNSSFSDIHHRFATAQADLLWNVSLMGVQTWNSIRALDFLESLPDADRKHLACTGESGGGTQTFMLGAVDDRLAAQSPVVMVSHSMQGGCLCENAPGLRVQFSNMEIAAAPAPRPQLLVAASGDWTRDTLTIEGPSIGHIYSLLGSRDKFNYVRYEFDHNYNQTSREAVYGFFNKWLLNQGNGKPLAEQPYHKEADADLRVFPDGKLPPAALTQDQLISRLKELHKRQYRALLPSSKSTLAKYKQILLPAWRHTMQLESPAAHPVIVTQPLRDCGEYTVCEMSISRDNESSQISGTYWAPGALLKSRSPKLAVLSNGDNTTRQANFSSNGPSGLTRELLKRGIAVFSVDHFSRTPAKDQFSNFFATYNRTLLQERVRDLITISAAAHSLDPRRNIAFEVTLIGGGKSGLWALMAAPGGDAVVSDCARLDTSDEHQLLANEVYCPGLLNLGAFEGVAILAAPRPLLLHNRGTAFSTEHLQSAYAGLKAGQKLTSVSQRLSDPEIADWVARRQ